MFVFVDTGEKGLRKIAITRFAEQNLQHVFESPDEPRPADKVLPETLGAVQAPEDRTQFRGPQGCAAQPYPRYLRFPRPEDGRGCGTRHFVPAVDLIEEYLDTRIPEVFDTYATMVQLTDVLARRALSNQVIHAGKTTVGDVRRWLYDQLCENRVGTWFQPDLRVQRRAKKNDASRGFLAVSPESTVIERGDVVHFGFWHHLHGSEHRLGEDGLGLA